LKDIFLTSSPVSETGAVAEFKEPEQMHGKLRWQIIRVMSDVGSDGRKTAFSDQEESMVLDSRESSRPVSTQASRPASTAQNADVDVSDGDKSTQKQTEVIYRGGIYLGKDATLKDLRNQFVDSKQLQEERNGMHFQFLRSDVPGDRIEIDTEDETLLSQIEDSLLNLL